MNQRCVLFIIGQIGIALQIFGSVLLVLQAYAARRFGGAESSFLGLGSNDEASLEGAGKLVVSLTRETKSQFRKQLPGFSFLLLGMIFQLAGNFANY